MKKNMLASMALGALLFVGCGSGVKDMKDINEKNQEYYESHQEEAYDKVKWCFDKLGFDVDEDLIRDTVEDVKETRRTFSFGYIEDIILDKFKTSKIYNEFDEINQSNCEDAYHVVFKKEFVKVFPNWFK